MSNYSGINGNSVDRGNLKSHLVLLSKAADSIADGDLVDRRIRSTQNWSLLPTQVTHTHTQSNKDGIGFVFRCMQFLTTSFIHII